MINLVIVFVIKVLDNIKVEKWVDLVNFEVKVIIVNLKIFGGVCWNFFGIWGLVIKIGGIEE